MAAEILSGQGNLEAELEMTEMVFRVKPLLNRYREIRNLARKLNRWETLQPQLLTFLEQGKNATLLIQIALDEGDIDHALQLLKGIAKKDSYGYAYESSGMDIMDLATLLSRLPDLRKRHGRVRPLNCIGSTLND